MRLPKVLVLAASSGALLWALSCSVQPGGGSGDPAAQAGEAPDPGAKLAPEPGKSPTARKDHRVRRRMPPIQPAKVEGPKAAKPAPLPKADKIVAIWHSGNVDGEIDPCG